MQKQWTHSAAFGFFGATPGNPRWSWSGRSEDGRTVAVTLWQDRFEEKGRVYRSWQTDKPGDWRSRPGFTELIRNLQLAKERADGEVRVIIAVPEDPAAVPRSIKRCFPQPNLRMRLTALDADAGTYVLERVEENSTTLAPTPTLA